MVIRDLLITFKASVSEVNSDRVNKETDGHAERELRTYKFVSYPVCES